MGMCWQERLERLRLALGSIRDAREALEPLGRSGELDGLLEEAEASLARQARALQGRIEAKESREESALEREYHREVI